MGGRGRLLVGSTPKVARCKLAHHRQLLLRKIEAALGIGDLVNWTP
jgi:hypothetical protein